MQRSQVGSRDVATSRRDRGDDTPSRRRSSGSRCALAISWAPLCRRTRKHQDDAWTLLTQIETATSTRHVRARRSQAISSTPNPKGPGVKNPALAAVELNPGFVAPFEGVSKFQPTRDDAGADAATIKLETEPDGGHIASRIGQAERQPRCEAAANSLQRRKLHRNNALNWSGRRDSNPRPQPWQGCVLSTPGSPDFLYVTINHYIIRYIQGHGSLALRPDTPHFSVMVDTMWTPL